MYFLMMLPAQADDTSEFITCPDPLIARVMQFHLSAFTKLALLIVRALARYFFEMCPMVGIQKLLVGPSI